MNFSIHDVLAEMLPPEQINNATEAKLLKKLQVAFPKNQIRFVRETPVANCFEVTMGANVAYVFTDTNTIDTPPGDETTERARFSYWMFGGNLFDLNRGIDHTANAKRLAQLIDVSALPIENAIKRVNGSGSRTLYVFTDPECPHCRRLEGYLEKLNDVTIYTFLTPLVQLHPKAREVAAQIWCAKKPALALVAYMTGLNPELSPAGCETPILENEKLMNSLSIRGTPTIVFETGERQTGALSLEQLESKLTAIDALKKKVLP